MSLSATRCFSVSYGLPVSERFTAVCEEKKAISLALLSSRTFCGDMDCSKCIPAMLSAHSQLPTGSWAEGSRPESEKCVMNLTFDDSTSDISLSSEHPGSRWDPTRARMAGLLCPLNEGFLLHDDAQRTPFDHTHFEIGDSHATGGGLPPVYDKSAELDEPNWQLLFKYLL